MAISHEQAISLVGEETEDYTFVLNALRECMPRSGVVDWHSYRSGNVSRSQGGTEAEDIGAVVLCELEDGSFDHKRLEVLYEEPAIDPAAAAIIRACAAGTPVVRHSVA